MGRWQGREEGADVVFGYVVIRCDSRVPFLSKTEVP